MWDDSSFVIVYIIFAFVNFCNFPPVVLGQQQQQQKQPKQTSIFGSPNTAGSTSLFGAQQPTAFGAPFGFGQPQQQQPSTTSFLSNPVQPQQSSLFGQAGTTKTTAGGLLASPATAGFGQPAAPILPGIWISKFQAPQETDTQIHGKSFVFSDPLKSVIRKIKLNACWNF